MINKDETTRFMFSNEDCSKYVITTYDQLSNINTIATSTANILSSHLLPDNSYNTQWYRPLISYYDQNTVQDKKVFYMVKSILLVQIN